MSKPPDKAFFIDMAHRMRLANLSFLPMGFDTKPLYLMEFASHYRAFYMRSANE